MASSLAFAAEIPFYVGCYTKPEGSKGIYGYKLDTSSGKVSGGDLAAEAKNPTFLAIDRSGKHLYAANEVGGQGSVSAYAIQPDQTLKFLNSQPAKGAGPCHVWIDGSDKYVLVANYGGGSVAALPIKSDGSLGEATGFVQHTGSSANPGRQKEPHAHAIYTDPANKFVYACDLGTDKVYIYKLDPEKGTLTASDPAAADLPPGSGPRHLAFHPKGGFAYVINELLSTVTTLKHDANTGALEPLETISTLPEGSSTKNSTAEIFAHPNGRFVYGSNRGHDSIAVFAIDSATGKLKLVEHTPTGGKAPRNFNLDPSGAWLIAANQDSNNMRVFKVDAESGKLTPTGQTLELGAPVCVIFPPQHGK